VKQTRKRAQKKGDEPCSFSAAGYSDPAADIVIGADQVINL
jgi:hypothetical protein